MQNQHSVSATVLEGTRESFGGEFLFAAFCPFPRTRMHHDFRT